MYLRLSYQLSSIDISRIERAIELGRFNENHLGKIGWYLIGLSIDEVTLFLDALSNTTIVHSTVLMSLFENETPRSKLRGIFSSDVAQY